MLGNVSIVKKAWGLMGLLTACLTVMVVTTLMSSRAIDTSRVEVDERVMPLYQSAFEFQLNVIQIQQWLTDISATRGLDGLNDGFDMAAEHFEKANGLLTRMEQLDPGREESYADLATRLDAFYSVGKRMAQAYVDLGPQGGNATMTDFDAAAEAMTQKVDELLTHAAEVRTEMLAQQVAIARDVSKNILLLALIVAVVMLGGLYMLIRAVQPLGALTQAALRIADNDLSGKVPHSGNTDEVGLLATAVSSMQDKLVRRVQEIAAVTRQVYDAVETMTAVADHTSMGVQQQRSETEQVATAMNEMTATVHEVARNTATAAESANQAQSEVDSGSKVVKETIGSIGKLAEEVRKGADVISRLESDSDNIGTVLDVIKGIAEQTNLLALNAAIEAARAGEQGRGFAVVADEVRTLAQRTQQSTQEIQQMIEKLQQGAQEAVRVMNEGRTQAETSVDQAGRAGRSLETIRASVGNIHEMSTQIATAAEEQSAVAEEINRNIVNISDVVEKTADGAGQTAAASEELGQLAEQLQAVVNRFKLG